jgi:prepilin-type N-terminal cleavage/methylation domain-containing protein
MRVRGSLKKVWNLTRRVKYFTLLELIIVVGIIGILAVIFLPNFLEAQTRSKVSVAKANARLLVNAAEAYRVDWNGYPPTAQRLPLDPYGILSDVQLSVLTTPVSYISPAAFHDPFGKVKSLAITVSSHAGVSSDYPIPDPPNPNRSLLYYNYKYFSLWTRNPLINVIGIALVSIGPDRRDSFGAFRPFPPDALPPLARQAGITDPHDTEYDPTNGTISGGDIFGFAGEVPGIH